MGEKCVFMPRISIIMSVYNGEATLPEALDSILNQTYSDWELIVCDDCSTDHSGKILESYAAKDGRIIYIRNPQNKGLAASLNHCLEHVHGSYIARMDCDDLSAETRLEEQLQFLDKHPEYDLVGTFMQAFDENGLHQIIESKLVPTKFDLPKGAPFSHATIMIRTHAMRVLNGYRISNHTVRTEDVDLWYRFFAAGFVGANLPKPLYLVRMDEAAYKRRKLKYMFHASCIIWNGCGLLQLPFYYKFYCVKPILSWILPRNLKSHLRKWLIK